ncbi:diacylglycerol kinase family protein [Porphyromonadaceae bacterium W3.11]|nr:diacylglycerol kinase family protein [Porphyromonadaceae bacterium W3.11]
MWQGVKSTFSLKRLRKSFRYAFRGIFHGVKSEYNLQIHTLALLLVIIFGFIFQVTRIEWLLLLLCIALVFSLELINSAIETLADEVSQEYSELIKRAKDYSAGAVLFAAIIAAIIGLIIFIPYLLAL